SVFPIILTRDTLMLKIVSSVGEVSVQRGGSVTIPCFYEDSYKTHVKYWCKGSGWGSCTPIVRTDFPEKNDEVSIRDDRDQRVFIVTMNKLTDGDSGYYWCGVEISRGSPVGTQVYVSVTEGKMSVLQTVANEMHRSVTIPCFYEDRYKTQVKYWCKGSDWSSCTIIVRTDSPKITGEASIRDDPDQRVFIVTMNNLTAGDSGCYWCRVENSRGPPVVTLVYLSVTEGKMSVLKTVTGRKDINTETGENVLIYKDQILVLINTVNDTLCPPLPGASPREQLQTGRMSNPLPEPKLCVEVSPTTSSRNLAASASFCSRGSDRQGPLLQPLHNSHCTQSLWPLLQVVSPLEGGPMCLLRAVPDQTPWV
uniref:Ig-like domain-containing protein n=1 Tax=Paramormyrops kingsleyae TaxID=1676925 RepID=A0A3B3S5Q5_9TELE